MFGKLADLIFGWPRYRWGWLVMLVAGVIVVAASGPLVGKFEGAQKNEQSGFLPDNAESVKVLQAEERLPGAESIAASVIVSRDGGLLPQDLDEIKQLKIEISESSPKGTTVTPSAPSQNNHAVLFSVVYQGESFPQQGNNQTLESLTETVERLRSQVNRIDRSGLEAKVGGQLGFAGDSIKIFQSINSTLLYATALLVLILLLVIYRSPIFWLLPMGAVVAAEVIARAGGYLLAESGATVTGQSAGILSVLVFGAGTDYALLLVARYREELRKQNQVRQAMQVALRKTAPTILASGSTVIAGLLCLSLAEVNAIAGLGPAGAVGILAAMISSVTILPALLIMGGRKAFWPLIPRLGSEGADAQRGAWRKIGEWVEGHKRIVLVCGSLLLAVMAVGLTSLSKPLTSDQSFRGKVESVQAQQLIEKSFPAGASSPTLILVPPGKNLQEVRATLEREDYVAEISPIQNTLQGKPGSLFSVVLKSDPGGSQALTDIKEMRQALKGSGALVGGSSAQELDLRQATSRDNWKLIPLITVLVALILIVLLRSLVMPLILVGTVLVSCAASLGAVSFFSLEVLGAPGVSTGLPIITFVFLVALGVDYNIFLAARAKEESQQHGSREGMLRALAVTGAVITSAGVVLAGTFSVLMVLPLWELTQVGLAVAFGVLLDTILIRSMMVPAISWSLGDKAWWPWKPGQN